MTESDFKTLEMKIDRLEDKIRSLNIENDTDALPRKVKELDSFLKEIADDYHHIEEEVNDDESSITKPLINKLNIYKKEIEKNERILEKKKYELKRLTQNDDLFAGRLTGADLYEAQNKVLLDQHKEIDNHGVTIEAIGENIKNANANLLNINNELNEQGEQIDRIDNKVHETEAITKQTNAIINRMTTRQKCVKYLSFIAIIVFGIFDVFWIIFSLYRYFR